MEMKLNKLGEQAISGTVERTKMRLSENASSMVFQLFTKNVYSNPIGTVVREITSNCFDSHIEAKINAPVRIKYWIEKSDNTRYISFIDYGVGMSPDRVNNIYGVYFESTKRVDNQQIGGFGIGGKTPLAYKRSTGLGEGEYDNSFWVITNYDGVRYTYLISEGEECPEITPIHNEPTTECNGTEIRIPILNKDLDNFSKEMVRQLYYFENVVFEGFDNESYYANILKNQYQIVRGKTFLYRGSEYSEYIHVCLGKVAYPIDYNVLGLNSNDYRLPLAVKLEVGEIGVTVSREQLDYSETTIKILKNKLEEVKSEIKERITKQYENIVTLEDYLKVKINFGKLEFGNGGSINVSGMIKQSDIDFSNFRYQFMKMPNDKQLFSFFFNTKSYGKKPSKSRYKNFNEFDGGYEALCKNSNILYINGEFNRKVIKQAYLKHTFELYHIIELRNLTENSTRYDIADLFNVHIDNTVDDNGKSVQYVQSLIDMQNEYFAIVQKYAQNYDTLDVPEDFIQNRRSKNQITNEMRKTSISVKFIAKYRSKTRVPLNDLFNYNSLIFYGTQENESELRNMMYIYEAVFENFNTVCNYDNYLVTNNGKIKKGSVMFIVLANNNLKYMQYCKHAYTVDMFYTKLLYRKEDYIKDYFQYNNIVEKYSEISKLYKDEKFALVSPKYAKKVNDLKLIIETMPSAYKNAKISNVRKDISRYINLDTIKVNSEQKKIIDDVEEILIMQNANENIMKYIDLPYYGIGETDSELIEILKKVMILQ